MPGWDRIVAGARVAAVEYLQDAHRRGEQAQGWQAGKVARDYIGARGYGQWFTHCLGHSIGFEVHSEAVNLDGFETRDTRRIIPGV